MQKLLLIFILLPLLINATETVYTDTTYKTYLPVIKTPLIYKWYLPVIQTPPNNAGYAYSRIPPELSDLLSMTYLHGWRVYPYTSGYIPHFSCDSIDYKEFDETVPNQYDDLYDYVDSMGDEPFYLIFLNEPEYYNQCVRTPEYAAHMYAQVIEIAPNAIIAGPQVSHGDYHNGWVWLREWYYWIDQLNLPHPEIGAIHTYMTEPAHLIVDSHIETFGTDTVWITEFGTGNPDVLEDMLTTYQNDPRVTRYFYFDPMGGYWGWVRLIDGDGNLTTRGDVWVDHH